MQFNSCNKDASLKLCSISLVLGLEEFHCGGGSYINCAVELRLHGVFSPQVCWNGVKVGLPLAHQLLLGVWSLEILDKLSSEPPEHTLTGVVDDDS